MAVVEQLDPSRDSNDLWLVDLETGLRSRFTFDPGTEGRGVWTPDGQRIIYVAQVDSLRRLVERPVEGTGDATILYESNHELSPTSMTPDGKTLIFGEEDPSTSWDIFALSMETGEKRPLVAGEGHQGEAMVSPDGRWLAYDIRTTSSWEVIVRPFSGGARQWQIDKDGGVYPFWSPDGSRLFYIEFSGEVMAVPVDGQSSTFQAGSPQSFARVAPPQGGGFYVSLHPDGERLIHVGGEVSEDETGFLRLVTDWRRGLAR